MWCFSRFLLGFLVGFERFWSGFSVVLSASKAKGPSSCTPSSCRARWRRSCWRFGVLCWFLLLFFGLLWFFGFLLVPFCVWFCFSALRVGERTGFGKIVAASELLHPNSCIEASRLWGLLDWRRSFEASLSFRTFLLKSKRFLWFLSSTRAVCCQLLLIVSEVNFFGDLAKPFCTWSDIQWLELWGWWIYFGFGDSGVS